MTKKEREKELRCYPAALTATEVSEILRVSVKTVYKLIKEKTLPAVKVGRENRIAKSQLIDYLQYKDGFSSNPRVYYLEKTSNNVWTYVPTCDIVCAGKNKKGVIKNECQNHTCSQRTG
jgi:excisionase family DNA binding protein